MGMKYNLKYTTGFTLIELLVVISIISLLSTVVISAMSSARNKGGDAAIKSTLNNIITQSLTLTILPGTVTAGACPLSGSDPFFTDSTVVRQIQSAQNLAKTTANCVASGGNWAISVPLNNPQNTGGVWCVDSDGHRGENTPTGYGFTGSACN